MNPIRLASVLLGATLLNAGSIYQVTDLGSLGGATSQAFGLSSNGWAAGAATTPFGYQHAFTSNGFGMTDLTLGTSASEGMAAAINAAGQVAGTQYIDGQAFATLWTGATTQSLAGAGSYATAINNAGQVAGMFTSGGQGQAFVMSQEGPMVDLGDLPGGTWTAAYGINNGGQVAGYGDAGSGTFRGFVWTAGSGYTEVGTLGGSNSYAMAINDSGEVTGNAQLASGYSHAFAEADGVMIDLGTLGGSSSYGYGVNDAGDVVGYSYIDGAGVTHAFLFENGVMIDLNNLIDPSSGWVLTEAYAINGSGEIVGAGIVNGVEHAFRLDLASGVTGVPPPLAGAVPAVPEPSAFSFVLTGGSITFLWRLRLRRRRQVPRPALPLSGASLP